MRLVPIECVKPNTLIGKTLYDIDGRILVRSGVILSEGIISKIKEINILSIYIIDEYSSEEIEDIIKPELRQKAILTMKEAFSNINRLTVAVMNPTIIEATVRIDDKKSSLLTLSTSKPNVKTMLTQRKKISILYFAVGLLDLIFQKRKFSDDMKMSKQEIKDEYKDTEGDPQIKQRQKQKMQEASQRRMMSSVPEADVVITNPTHIAVALKYNVDDNPAPIVVAKGEGYIAQKIKDKARENNVMITENKPLARALFATVEIGEAIPPELYEAVAEILALVYNTKK